jgi:hypothetical protein
MNYMNVRDQYPDDGMASHEGMQKLATACNLIVEELYQLEEKPAFDPVEQVPVEVWTSILKEL